MRILTPFPSGPLLCCTNVRAEHKLALFPRLLECGLSREPVFSAVRVSKSCKTCGLVCTYSIERAKKGMLEHVCVWLKTGSPPPRDLKNICSYMLGFSQGVKDGGRAPSFLRQNIFDVVIITTHVLYSLNHHSPSLIFFWLEPDMTSKYVMVGEFVVIQEL